MISVKLTVQLCINIAIEADSADGTAVIKMELVMARVLNYRCEVQCH
jgi:hypothetical protein